MSNDHQFLSFKGLKYYNPNEGWNQLNDPQKSYFNPIHKPEHLKQSELKELTKTVTTSIDSKSIFFDPLMKDLLDRVCVDASDALSTVWKDIADEIDLLEQYLSTKRELIEQMNILDQEANELSATIIEHLDEAQELADQQIFTASLRAKISAVAQSRLLVKLDKVGVQKNKQDVSNNFGAAKEKV
jgi:hypothetical protein